MAAKDFREFWLDFASHFGYLSSELYDQLVDRYDHTCSQLSIMMSQPQKWVPKSKAD